jgi:hypothetical protein
VPDNDLVVTDKDFLDEQPHDTLAFRYVEAGRCRAQSRKECREGFGKAQVGRTVDRLIEEGLQFDVGRLLAPPQVWHTLAQFIQ